MFFKLVIFSLLLSYSYGAKVSNEYESQPNIIFNNDYIKKQTNNLELRINFNNAVLYLEQEKYIKAINLFKLTAPKLKVPSFLNIGIAYYKLKSSNNAYLYLKKLYDLKELPMQDLYSYVSASYYLYLITDNRKYITAILDSVKKSKREKINDSVKLLLSDTYIILKQYDKAIKIIKSLKDFNNLKLALLYLKVKNYDRAELYLSKAIEETKDDDEINKILWFQVYTDLKTNNIAKIKEHINLIHDRLDIFRQSPRMPLKIYFNRDKYDASEYFSKILNFDIERKIDLLFYFVPFIFSDNKQILEESTFAFVLKNSKSMESLNTMINYNKKFVDIVKMDPILRVNKLQKYIDKNDNIKSYEYYNLGLSYAQIFNYKEAHRYFTKAYMLDKANKLYSSLTLISAIKAEVKIVKKSKTVIMENLLSNHGTYKYLGKYIYKSIMDNNYVLDDDTALSSDKKTIIYRFLEFINNKEKDRISLSEPLLQKDIKDPLVFLFHSLAKLPNESQYDYVSRLQDYIPKHFNDYFLKGPIIITQYYIDTLKALGIFNKVSFKIKGDNSPTYLRTKALINLYDGYAISSIKTIENLQEKYNLSDKYTYNLLIASYLSSKDYSNASATLSMLQFELKDKDAKFLNGVQLIQNLKLNSAKSSFEQKYKGRLIDFKLEGLDEFIEDL